MRYTVFFLALFAFALGGAPTLAGEGFHLIGEGGFLFSHNAEYRDVHPEQNPPTPLYGVGYRAAGQFGNAGAFGAGFGFAPYPLLRLDFRFTDYPSLKFKGESNFLPPTALEPVTGTVHADSLLAGAYLDLGGIPGWPIAGFRPYAGGGFGLTINRQHPMLLSYPSLAVPHTLTTPSGSRADFAWKACAGFSVPVLPNLSLDLEYRYTDLGQAKTAEGDAVMVRPSIQEVKIIPIGATYAPLRFHGVFGSVRVKF